MDRVGPHPRPCRVRTLPPQHGPDVDRALTTRFHPAARRLQQDRKIALHEIRPLREEPAQAVQIVGDLLAFVEHERHVARQRARRRARELAREVEHDRHATLHVGRPEPVEDLAVPPRSGVVVGRHRVEVTAQHNPRTSTALRARDHVRGDALDGKRGRLCTQPAFDDTREHVFVSTHRGNAAEVFGECEQVSAGHETMPCSRRIALSCNRSCC